MRSISLCSSNCRLRISLLSSSVSVGSMNTVAAARGSALDEPGHPVPVLRLHGDHHPPLTRGDDLFLAEAKVRRCPEKCSRAALRSCPDFSAIARRTACSSLEAFVSRRPIRRSPVRC